MASTYTPPKYKLALSAEKRIINAPADRQAQQQKAIAFKQEKQKQGKFTPNPLSGSNQSVVRSQDTAPAPNLATNFPSLDFQTWALQNQLAVHNRKPIAKVKNQQQFPNAPANQFQSLLPQQSKIPTQQPIAQNDVNTLGGALRQDFANFKADPTGQLKELFAPENVALALGAAPISEGIGQVGSAIASRVGGSLPKFTNLFSKAPNVQELAQKLGIQPVITDYMGNPQGILRLKPDVELLKEIAVRLGLPEGTSNKIIQAQAKAVGDIYSSSLSFASRATGQIAKNPKIWGLTATAIGVSFSTLLSIYGIIKGGIKSAEEDPKASVLNQFKEPANDAINLESPELLASAQEARRKSQADINRFNQNKTVMEFLFPDIPLGDISNTAQNYQTKILDQSEQAQLYQKMNGLSQEDLFKEFDTKQVSDLAEIDAKWKPLISIATFEGNKQDKLDAETSYEKKRKRKIKELADVKLQYLRNEITAQQFQDQLYGDGEEFND